MSEGPDGGGIPGAGIDDDEFESPGAFLGPSHVVPATAEGELPVNALDVSGGWLVVLRLRTLYFALVPTLVALLLLVLHGTQLSPVVAVAAVISVALVQLGASLLDTYVEHARFVRHHTEEWEDGDESGLRTLLLRSGVYPLDALRASILLLTLGAAAGIPLVVSGGATVALLGIAGLLAAFLYSSTGHALKRYPIGDLLILLALGPGIVTTVMLAAHRAPSLSDLELALALGFFALAPVEALHLRDREYDRAHRRRTLVALLGRRWGRALYGFCILAGYLLIVVAAFPTGQPHGALLAFLGLPAAVIPLTGSWAAGPILARAPVVGQAIRAYLVLGIWLVFGLLLSTIILRLDLLPR
ncbi:MAG TPA: prenyltransferase [Ktedonobacterales bacterium]|jgi:1,4-dihydroxy-2-naphthoate octaprenyltransferase|nr:prenyltransferase [Ktedonobacterales bacterium]